MAEYIEREAAAAIFRDARKSLSAKKYDYMANEYLTRDTMLLNAEQIIRVLPAADVAPVVRCKDCKHSYEDLCGRVCSYGVSVDCVVPDDFFCADGAKMEVTDERT